MSATPISFFTPIKYGHQSTSIRQKITEFVDEYFHLRGRVALVIPGKIIHGSESVELQPGQAIGWHSVLKVMSYTAYFFNLFITTQFPMITAYRGVVQFQMILNSLPIFMMIAKVILRSISRFHIDSEPKEKENRASGIQEKYHQQAQDDTPKTVKGEHLVAHRPPIDPEPKEKEDKAPSVQEKYQQQAQDDTSKIVNGGHPVAHSLPIDLIPLELKATLDNLFGGPGSVDRLPVFKGDISKSDVDTMPDPIMKGTVSSSLGKNPYIAIKMRCLSSLEEVKKKFPFTSIYEPIERIVLLRTLFIEDPLSWVQDEGYGISPQFFKNSAFYDGNFTYPQDGQLTEGQTKAFELLQRLIKEGSGADSNGLRWEIIGRKS